MIAMIVVMKLKQNTVEMISRLMWKFLALLVISVIMIFKMAAMVENPRIDPEIRKKVIILIECCISIITRLVTSKLEVSKTDYVEVV